MVLYLEWTDMWINMLINNKTKAVEQTTIQK